MTSASNHPASSSDELCRLMLAIAQERDRTAFAALFQYFAPRIKSFLLRSGVTGMLADEILQETMLAVWQKAGYFDPAKAGVSTWVFTIARNQRVDRLRRERGIAAANIREDMQEEADPSPSAEMTMMVNERSERVRDALKTLSPEQAAIVRLSFISDKPHAEIARELNIPLGTVKSRIRLALGHLRALLDNMA